MKRTIIFCIFLMSLSQLFAQNHADTIEVKNGLGVVFKQNGKNLPPRQLLKITESNAEAFKEMKIAKSNSSAGNVFGVPGGFLVGWTLGTAIGGGKPNWAVAGIGAGLIVISLPFSTAYSKHAKNAVRIYNAGVKQTAMNKVDYSLGLTSYGIGVKMKF